eukprot:558396-Rhodomonas_salina.2
MESRYQGTVVYDCHVYLTCIPKPQYITDNRREPVIHYDFQTHPPRPIETGFFFRGEMSPGALMVEELLGKGQKINYHWTVHTTACLLYTSPSPRDRG